MQISTEDYLRIMYSLFERAEEPEKGIRSSDIALSLGISKPSVSSMLKKFKEQRLVRCSPYSKIFFTKKGEKEAKRIMHNHRVIEVFLRKILRYDIRKVHEEANRLEHAFSEESIKRLDDYLRNPKISPFGEKIPHQHHNNKAKSKTSKVNKTKGEH